MGYGVTVAQIFGAKGLTAKILKARELACGFGTGQRPMGYLVLLHNSCKIETRQGQISSCSPEGVTRHQPLVASIIANGDKPTVLSVNA